MEGRWRLYVCVGGGLLLVAGGFLAIGGAALSFMLGPCAVPYLLAAARAKRSWIEYMPGVDFLVSVAPFWWWRPVESTRVEVGRYRIIAKFGIFVGVPSETYRFEIIRTGQVLHASTLWFRRRDWKPFRAALEAGALPD